MNLETSGFLIPSHVNNDTARIRERRTSSSDPAMAICISRSREEAFSMRYSCLRHAGAMSLRST